MDQSGPLPLLPSYANIGVTKSKGDITQHVGQTRLEELMPTVTIAIPDDLSAQLYPYRDNLDNLLRVGLREVKMGTSLTLFQKGDLSLESRSSGGRLATRDDPVRCCPRAARTYRPRDHPGRIGMKSEHLCDQALAQARREAARR